MAMIGELATPYPIEVLTTTRVDHAAQMMAEFGIGDVVVTDPTTGAVAGMFTDRDITVRLVARNLDPQAPKCRRSSPRTPQRSGRPRMLRLLQS